MEYIISDYSSIGLICICLIICIGIWIYKNKNNKSLQKTNNKCIISNDLYPEIQEIVNNKENILSELAELIIKQKWSVWGSGYNKIEQDIVPRFSDMSTKNKIDHLANNMQKLGNDHKWKIFGLILEKQPILENISKCPDTYQMIHNIKGLINAGFSCLEPHTSTPYHNDSDERFYRIHIPLIVPDVPDDEIRLDVYDENKNLIKLNWKTDYFVFNDNCYHQALNNTDYHRIVLLLDIERRS